MGNSEGFRIYVVGKATIAGNKNKRETIVYDKNSFRKWSKK